MLVERRLRGRTRHASQRESTSLHQLHDVVRLCARMISIKLNTLLFQKARILTERIAEHRNHHCGRICRTQSAAWDVQNGQDTLDKYSGEEAWVVSSIRTKIKERMPKGNHPGFRHQKGGLGLRQRHTCMTQLSLWHFMASIAAAEAGP